MKFEKYNHIENAYNSKIINIIRLNKLDDPSIVYACYRKIDGCNVQFSIDEENNFTAGSRNRFLSENEIFGNWQTVVERDNIELKLKQIKDILLNRKISDEKLNEWLNENENFTMICFGELCGGLYRHKDVERDTTAIKIQGKVSYSPSNQWILFDIKLINKDKSIFLNLDTVKQLCNSVNLLYQIEDYRGTFDECLKFPVEFNDNTGNIFWNLPLINDNIAEGVVIKPIESLCIGNERVILKNKNLKFKERIKILQKNHKESKDITNKEQYWFNILKEYMNENRVLSAISKVGCDNFGSLMKESCCDAIEEFKKDNENLLEKDMRELDLLEFNFSNVTKSFNKYSTKIVKDVFLNNR